MKQHFLMKKRLSFLGFLLVLVGIACAAMTMTQFSIANSFSSIPKAMIWGCSNFYPTADSFTNFPDIMLKLQETLLISIASASVAAIFAFVFALLGSQVTKINNTLAAFSRFIANVFRNIDVSIWALVLLFSFGQSSLTGYFALFVASFGFLTRAFMETIDEVGSGAIEALRATGAHRFSIIFQAVLPMSMSQLISWVLFMIETNIRAATLVGILTGSGIGFIFDLYYKRMDYHSASLVVLAIVVSILVIEQISNYVRRAML
ncbi:PhnE/PtxC family ABC transporter permease [Sporolactobacillus terrae]|uniref:Phosphonate ABC transporter permease n=1 Tax=Sporolactobacillus terrae TaxID=269673 RepID=A0ABX5Q3X6_9BACL|nr:ABC transporter permease subunit [Sporolactobacillus terrae]QAA21329.1 phosphonate ABC transporter permease [Sporolactobacillus terrae]QAA24301.1 phosphonate ABC transporter permease [Sporolactobacillus terrae]UAK16105.1 ABC transporter permease subunit [Sporolactobacillus terrae]